MALTGYKGEKWWLEGLSEDKYTNQNQCPRRGGMGVLLPLYH